MKVKTHSIIDDIKWEMFHFRMKFIMMRFNMKDKYFRTKYCRRGLHKLAFGKIIVQKGFDARKRRTSHYISCQYCNYKFFTTHAQKKKYLELESFPMTKEEFSALMKSFREPAAE